MEIILYDSIHRQIQTQNKFALPEARGEKIGSYYNTNGYKVPFRVVVLDLWVITHISYLAY